MRELQNQLWMQRLLLVGGLAACAWYGKPTPESLTAHFRSWCGQRAAMPNQDAELTTWLRAIESGAQDLDSGRVQFSNMGVCLLARITMPAGKEVVFAGAGGNWFMVSCSD